MMSKLRIGEAESKELAYFKMLLKEATNEMRMLIKAMPDKKGDEDDAWVDNDLNVNEKQDEKKD
jgi:hypothetical protein